jgi:hypothetical protein
MFIIYLYLQYHVYSYNGPLNIVKLWKMIDIWFHSEETAWKYFTLFKHLLPVMNLRAGVIVALHLRISHVRHEMAESVLSSSFVTFILPVQKLTSGDKQRCRSCRTKGAGHDIPITLSSLRTNTKTRSTCHIDNELLSLISELPCKYWHCYSVEKRRGPIAVILEEEEEQWRFEM